MWRLSYSPAPESSIRSTLQPDSPIYELDSNSEAEASPSTFPPYSPKPASLAEDFGNGSETATPEPLPPESIAGPKRSRERVPKREPRSSSQEKTRESTAEESESGEESSTPVAGSPARLSPSSSHYNSHSSDNLDAVASNLQTYILDENGQKKYPCLRCDKIFGRSHDRKRHMEESTSCRGSQLGREQDIGTAPMWVCSRCGDSFSRRDSMNRHMKNPDACKGYRRLVR